MLLQKITLACYSFVSLLSDQLVATVLYTVKYTFSDASFTGLTLTADSESHPLCLTQAADPEAWSTVACWSAPTLCVSLCLSWLTQAEDPPKPEAQLRAGVPLLSVSLSLSWLTQAADPEV